MLVGSPHNSQKQKQILSGRTYFLSGPKEFKKTEALITKNPKEHIKLSWVEVNRNNRQQSSIYANFRYYNETDFETLCLTW